MWEKEYKFTEATIIKLEFIASSSENGFKDFIATVEGEYPEISSFHINSFAVYISTDDDRFKEIQRKTIRLIDKTYKKFLNE